MNGRSPQKLMILFRIEVFEPSFATGIPEFALLGYKAVYLFSKVAPMCCLEIPLVLSKITSRSAKPPYRGLRDKFKLFPLP